MNDTGAILLPSELSAWPYGGAAMGQDIYERNPGGGRARAESGISLSAVMAQTETSPTASDMVHWPK